MSDRWPRAKVYAVEKQGPINVGAGMTDYIHKVFAKSGSFHIVVQVDKGNYESHAAALLQGKPGEVVCDPSLVLSLQYQVEVVPQSALDAIAATREKSVRTS